jgi:hypothetical protein
MINAQVSTLADRKPATQVRRIGQRGFWLLFAFEGLCIAGMLILVLHLLLPARAPLAQAGDYAAVRAAIEARLNGATDDPLIEVAPGVTARSSNVRGFTLNGYTYYYYRDGQPGFDPLSRGAVARDQVELVSRAEVGRNPLVIYRVLSKDRATN